MFLLLLLGVGSCFGAEEEVFSFPLQFKADVLVTAHLVDESVMYPPRERRVELTYDFVNKRARAHIVSGIDQGKTFTRRYDLSTEYMEDEDFCQRSYLGEAMPGPLVLPKALKVGDGHYRIDDNVDVHNFPSSLVYSEEGIRVMTYEFSNVVEIRQGEQFPSVRENCTLRHIGGWPYLHLFHSYVMI